MASLVPEPIEKCAVWAASPSSTTLPSCQRSLRTVVKLSHLELLVRTAWPPQLVGEDLRDPGDRVLVGDARAGRPVSSVASKPARRHTSSCISTMKVEPESEYG